MSDLVIFYIALQHKSGPVIFGTLGWLNVLLLQQVPEHEAGQDSKQPHCRVHPESDTVAGRVPYTAFYTGVKRQRWQFANVNGHMVLQRSKSPLLSFFSVVTFPSKTPSTRGLSLLSYLSFGLLVKLPERIHVSSHLTSRSCTPHTSDFELAGIQSRCSITLQS